jgi:single-strand selective monofunctional uracil DNA glycosylase
LGAVDVSRRLALATAKLRFATPVTHVYDPTTYARVPHETYLTRFASGPREVLMIGMNPGPFGMAQTGVPFGDVGMARDFLGIVGEVGRPAREHPKRPVQGFACPRSEVSGTRLWGWARARFGTPEAFFARFFVWNYCPLAFMDEGGRNLTPDKLPARERAALEAACDEGLRGLVGVVQPRLVVGIGGFAEGRARAALVDRAIPVGGILHPSPASPAANKNWAGTIERQLAELGVRVP